MRPMSAFLLKVWHAKESSTEPARLAGESNAVFIKRYDAWQKSHHGTAALLHQMSHAGVSFASKVSFMAEWDLYI
jgi:hypothetical protein